MRRCLFLILFILSGAALFAQQESEVSPEGHFQLAERALSRDDCSLALRHINKTIAGKPSDEAYALRAMIHECLNDFTAAITDYSVLIHRHHEHPEYLFSRGVLLYRTGQYQPAIEDLKMSLLLPMEVTNKIYYKVETGEKGISGMSTLKTMQGEVYNYIGLAYHELNQSDSAIANFSRSISMGSNPQILNNRAMVYEKINLPEKAIADYEEALKLDEDNQVAKYNLINLYGKLKDYNRQKAILGKLGAGEKLPEIYVFRGVAAYNSGDYRLAVMEYDSAISADGENEEYFVFRGQAYEKLKKFDKAINDFQQAISLDAKYPNAYFNLANVYYSKNDLDNAISNYDMALLYNAKYANAYLNRGIVYLRKKNLDKACQDLNTARSYGLEGASNLFGKKCLDQ